MLQKPAELSYGNLWRRIGTDTYLGNMTDNVVIGTNTSAPGYKFYVFGATSQMSRFDGQVEFWNTAGGIMDADINDDGLGNGVFSLYDAGGFGSIRLRSGGDSYFASGKVCIGATNPLHLLHLIDPIGVAAPQLKVDNASGAGNSSIGYGFTGLSFAEGLDGSTGNFKLCNTPGLVPSMQGDGMTMYRAFNNGIMDFNNQSRARVFLMENQMIPNSVWHPIDFTMITYDQHMEWTPGAGSPMGGPPMSYFTATEEGYYQVNARTAYFLGEEMDNWWVNYDAFVSIAIYKRDVQGNWNMHAQGNNLQIGQAWNPQGPMEMGLSFKHNNAPNVSDVIYLQKGERIAIYTWQSAGFPLNLIPGSAKTYCSVHKSS
ncbi:MAG: hypothetical protein R2764_04275 [Bacteroidales bacterium]